MTKAAIVRTVGGVVVVLLLTAGLCSGDSDTSDIEEVATTVAASSNADTNTQDSSAATGSEDFQTIWGIPPFGVSRVDPAFGAYTVIDDDFQFNESVFFQIEGTTVDEVIAYYQDLLRSMGYTVADPFVAGGSQVLSPDDGDPETSAVLQVGPTTPGSDVLSVNQGRSRFKTSPGDDGETPVDGSSDTSDDAVSESDG